MLQVNIKEALPTAWAIEGKKMALVDIEKDINSILVYILRKLYARKLIWNKFVVSNSLLFGRRGFCIGGKWDTIHILDFFQCKRVRSQDGWI